MTHAKPTITVAIPSYNKEKYIARCIESILAEKDLIDAIVLVDNCSTDKTYEIAKTYEPDITCYQNDTNIGMAGNWNKCIELCNTDWLMIVHADDEVLPGAIKEYRDILARYPSLGLISASSGYSGTNIQTKSVQGLHEKDFFNAGIEAMESSFGICSSVMVKKEAYDHLGMFIQDSLSSDGEMWIRIASKYDVGFINKPTALYRVNPESTGLTSLTNRKLKDIKRDWDLLTKQIASHYPTDESRKEYLRKSYMWAPYAYWNVLKENIKKGNILMVLQTLWLIIVTYRGLVPLVRLSSTAVKNGIKKIMPGRKKASI
ncbi:MAG: hypothetical protein COU32_00975 [Candidatus Magasanikbacteria bacterium CG10_big_fil_rev_8_21_14_0_10_42_10]|uniref:Glycosyltransferase 2-like domain-containing protein n=1 Tax=Candidatus Magasanikbacteria bacterium CG10_big_fil_rev_8_21_14_0_10_42_10 TaxID=1974649 RepID=A0A2H0TWV1_9BACT|nr:MAG: hypothetical protein COU32_00975 [Candidatus Magasanikbacteria bacterium CG10_big_fil_rev_8_21_14_0_10_42_10]